MAKTCRDLHAFSWGKFSWTEIICVKKLTFCNSGHCSWETFDNCGCHGWMIERVTQTEIVTIDDGCFCGAGLDLKRKNFLSWQCRSPTCRRRNVVQYLLTMLHILEMMKNAKIMLMRIQKLAKRFWWRNLSHKNADILWRRCVHRKNVNLLLPYEGVVDIRLVTVLLYWSCTQISCRYTMFPTWPIATILAHSDQCCWYDIIVSCPVPAIVCLPYTDAITTLQIIGQEKT